LGWERREKLTEQTIDTSHEKLARGKLVNQTINSWYFLTFLRRTGGNGCSKQREGRTEENKHGNQRGTEVEKIKIKRRDWMCHVTKTHEIPNQVLQD